MSTNNTDICGMINPTLTLSGTCAECGGSGRIPLHKDEYQCDECDEIYRLPLGTRKEDDFLLSRPEHMMPCGHEAGLYYPFTVCVPCHGIGNRQETVSVTELFDLLEDERERRKQEEDDRREQAICDRMGRMDAEWECLHHADAAGGRRA